MNKKNLALDIDSVLANTMDMIITSMGIKISKDKITDYDFLKTKYGSNSFWSGYNFSWENNKMIRREEGDSPTTVRELSEIIDVSYVTCRRESMRGQTKDWLKRNDFPELPLIICNKPEEKMVYDIIVDDRSDMVDLVRNKEDKILYLFDQPWNKSVGIFLLNNVTRVKSLKEVYNEIKKEA